MDIHALLALDGDFSFGLISGWTLDVTQGAVGLWNPAHGQTGCEIPDDFIDGIPGSVQVGFLYGGDISQQTGATITVGHRYTLTVGVGGYCFSGGRPYAIQLRSGTTNTVLTQTTGTSPKPGWIEVTVTYVSPTGDITAGEPLTVVIENIGGGVELNYDNFGLTAFAP